MSVWCQGMRKPIVAANWKMNGSLELCEHFTGNLVRPDYADVWIFPTALHLRSLTDSLRDTDIATGAQNVWCEPNGAYTGEISATMVATLGAQLALVGHSERRASFGDSDEVVAKKFKSITDAGLKPVLCVGETLEERDSGLAFEAVERQLKVVEEAWDRPVYSHEAIAYEPVWAIGTGKAATAEIAQEMHALIRNHVGGNGTGESQALRILYGGSVKAVNAPELIAQEDIDGFLVGGASLDVNEFNQICEAVKS